MNILPVSPVVFVPQFNPTSTVTDIRLLYVPYYMTTQSIAIYHCGLCHTLFTLTEC